jgi:hypothetical protein
MELEGVGVTPNGGKAATQPMRPVIAIPENFMLIDSR